MTIRPILTIPNPVLKRVSEPVEQVTDDIRTLIADMFDTMYDAPGIGLAAIQIGVLKRVVVIDLAKKEDEADPRVYLNPEIIWESEEERVYEEGCLSIPEYYEEVIRPDRIKVRFMTLEGDTKEEEADGLLATCLQHEIDHLNGVLFIDHLSRLKRERVMTKFTKAARTEAKKTEAKKEATKSAS